MNEPKHPPLNTPLSDFTPEMLDALPVGSRFDEANTNGGVLEKCPDGWRYIDGSRCECVGFPDGYNGDRPLIRVGPEQASEPAPVVEPLDASDLILDAAARDLAAAVHRIRTGTPSATLPDPWPGYLVAFTYADVTRRHAIRDSATVNGETVFCPAGGFSEDVYLDWTPDVVQEVRTPDGTTLWKRPAANGGAR